MHCSNCGREMKDLYVDDNSYIEVEEIGFGNDFDDEKICLESLRGNCYSKHYCDKCNIIRVYRFSYVEKLDFSYDVDDEHMVDFILHLAIKSVSSDNYNLETIRLVCSNNNLDYNTIKNISECWSVANLLANKYRLFDPLHEEIDELCKKHNIERRDDDIPF